MPLLTKNSNNEVLDRVEKIFQHDVEVIVKSSGALNYKENSDYLRKRVTRFLQEELDNGSTLASITQQEAYDKVGITGDTEDFGMRFILLNSKRVAIFCKNGISFEVIAKFERLKYLN